MRRCSFYSICAERELDLFTLGRMILAEAQRALIAGVRRRLDGSTASMAPSSCRGC